MEVNVLYLTLLEDKKKFEISVGFFGSQTHDRLKVASWIHSTSVFSCPQSPAGLAFIEGRGVCSPLFTMSNLSKMKSRNIHFPQKLKFFHPKNDHGAGFWVQSLVMVENVNCRRMPSWKKVGLLSEGLQCSPKTPQTSEVPWSSSRLGFWMGGFLKLHFFH